MPVVDAGGDFDLAGDAAGDVAAAAAGGAGLADDLAAAAAGGAGGLQREEAGWTAPPGRCRRNRGRFRGLVPGLAPRAAAGFARLVPLELDDLGRAVGRLEQVQA